jgi:hypothetical protein
LLLLGVTTLLAQSGHSRKADPSETCKYNPDNAPAQIGPGRQTDGDYDFAYVSDYEAKAQNYRRRICNATNHRVWFDWQTTALKGWCDTGGILGNEIPYPSEPKADDGPLRYDFRDTAARAYVYQPSKSKTGLRSLWSSLSGYVRRGDTLEPVTVGFGSEVHDNQFAYIIENRSDVPVKIYWKAFSEYWRKKQPDAYAAALEQQAKEGILSADSRDGSITVLRDRKSFWAFTTQGVEPEAQYSQVVIHSPETNPDPEKPDLAAPAALYLPANNVVIGERR